MDKNLNNYKYIGITRKLGYQVKSIINFLNRGHERSIKAKKNVLASFVFRGFNIALAFLLVPMALSYLGPTRYGIWLTISSITGYLMFFDIGLGSGLRTKFAEAVALEDKKRAKIYVSTTYAIISLIIISFFILFLFINPLLSWTKILNANSNFAHELSILAIIVFGFFSFRFIFQLISTILLSDQRPALRELILLITQFFIVISIFIVLKFTSGSLITFGLVYSATPVIVLILASIYFFKKDYKEYLPSIKYIDFKYYKDLINLGLKFFILKINVIVLLTTDNIIITQLYNPSYVTTYQIAHKYFFLIIMGFSIITSPFWSAVTEAYNKNEFNWIKNSIRKLLYVWIGFMGINFLMLFISGYFYKIWVGDTVSIPFKLSLGMSLFVLVGTLNSPFASFNNGVGKIKIKAYFALFTSLINIPLSIIFAKFLGLGIMGIILATTVCSSIILIINFIQYVKIINNRAEGIWNK